MLLELAEEGLPITKVPRSPQIKPTTLKRYRKLLTVHVVPMIGSVRITELRPAAIRTVATKVLAHRSPRTAVNVYKWL